MARPACALWLVAALARIGDVSAGYAVGVEPSGALPVLELAAALPAARGAAPRARTRADGDGPRNGRRLVRRGAVPRQDGAALTDTEVGRALTCSSVTSKARKIVSALKEMRAASEGENDPAVQDGGWLYIVERQLESSLTGPTVLDNFNRVLNAMDFGAGLRYGQVWTIQHAESFYQCNGLSGSLEQHGPGREQNPLGGSRRIAFCGGDMVCSGRWTNASGGDARGHTTGRLSTAQNTPHRSPSRWGDGHQHHAAGGGTQANNGTGQANASRGNGSNASEGERSNASSLFEAAADASGSSRGAEVGGGGDGPHWERKLWEVGPLPPPPQDSPRNRTDLIHDAATGTAASNATAGSPPSSGYRLPFHEVLYCFSSTVLSVSKEAFEAAIADIQQQVPCVSFRPVERYTDRNDCVEVPSILVQSEAEGCWSHVGQVSGASAAFMNRSQPLNIGQGCGAKGLVTHQLGHALGLLHEMYRPDRKDVIELQTGNVEAARIEDSFQIVQDVEMHVDAGASSVDAGFDFLSVMMYGAFSFSTNGLLVSKPRDLRAVGFMGQRMGLSELDVRVLGELYGCNGNVTPTDSNAKLAADLRSAAGPGASSREVLAGSGYQLRGDCLDGNSTGFFDTLGNNISCDGMRAQCSHTSLGEAIRRACPRTCHECVPDMWPALTASCLLCEDVAVHGWHAR